MNRCPDHSPSISLRIPEYFPFRHVQTRTNPLPPFIFVHEDLNILITMQTYPDSRLFSILFNERSNDAGINILFQLNDEKYVYLPYLHNTLIKMQISSGFNQGTIFFKRKNCSTDNYSMQKVVYLSTFWFFVLVTV